VRRIGLAALHVRLDVGRRHQPNLVAQPDQLARPVVARSASLHSDKTGRKLRKERQHLRPPQRSANGHLAGGVGRVNLKDVLGQVEADSGNLHGGWLPSLVVSLTASTLALRRREREPSTPSALGRKQTSGPRRQAVADNR